VYRAVADELLYPLIGVTIMVANMPSRSEPSNREESSVSSAAEEQLSLAAMIEQAIKYFPGALGAIYLVGFIVIGTYHERYGIVLLDLVRARMLAAGFLCAFLAAAAIIVLVPPLSMEGALGWLSRIVLFGGLGVFVLRHGLNGQARTMIWTCVAVPLSYIFLKSLERKTTILALSKMFVTPIVVFVLADVFGYFVYGECNPAIGGGMPRPITIHFNRSPALSNPSASAYLIEEDVRGYYVTYDVSSHKATFIPRETIGSIDFEELEAFSPLK